MTVPHYDLGITILVAGNFDLFSKIQEVVTVAAVRTAEQIAIQQLQKRYAGTYASSNPDLNSSMTLVADHRGLVVTEFISNATALFATELRRAFGAPRDGEFYVQLVPTLLYRNESTQSGESWRITTTSERAEGERNTWDDFCMEDVGGVNYAGLPISEVVFWDGEGTAFETLELPGFRVKLSRKEDDAVQLAQEHQEMLEL